MSNDQSKGRKANAARPESRAVDAKPDKASPQTTPAGKVGPGGTVAAPAPAERRLP